MRRVALLLVVALVGAGFAGRLVGATAVSVQNVTVSSAAMRAELSDLARDPAFACYENLTGTLTTTRASRSAVAGWVESQIEELSIEYYATTHDHWRASTADLRAAQSQLAAELSGESRSTPCATSASQALASLAPSLRTTVDREYAATIDFVDRTPGGVALTSSGLAAYYASHASDYDRICVSVAVVPESSESAFLAARKKGDSVAELARKFSIDPSAAQGGAYGCYSPSSSSYSVVRDDTLGYPLNRFPATGYEEESSDGETYVLFVAATSRTPSTYAESVSQVRSDAQAVDGTLAAGLERDLIKRQVITVDPSLVRYATSTVTISRLLLPPAEDTPNAGAGLALS